MCTSLITRKISSNGYQRVNERTFYQSWAYAQEFLITPEEWSARCMRSISHRLSPPLLDNLHGGIPSRYFVEILREKYETSQRTNFSGRCQTNKIIWTRRSYLTLFSLSIIDGWSFRTISAILRENLKGSQLRSFATLFETCTKHGTLLNERASSIFPQPESRERIMQVATYDQTSDSSGISGWSCSNCGIPRRFCGRTNVSFSGTICVVELFLWLYQWDGESLMLIFSLCYCPLDRFCNFMKFQETVAVWWILAWSRMNRAIIASSIVDFWMIQYWICRWQVVKNVLFENWVWKRFF